jgi:hypothetical protein
MKRLLIVLVFLSSMQLCAAQEEVTYQEQAIQYFTYAAAAASTVVVGLAILGACVVERKRGVLAPAEQQRRTQSRYYQRREVPIKYLPEEHIKDLRFKQINRVCERWEYKGKYYIKEDSKKYRRETSDDLQARELSCKKNPPNKNQRDKALRAANKQLARDKRDKKYQKQQNQRLNSQQKLEAAAY